MNLSIDDVSEYLEQWHKYGEYGMAVCVWHDDHNPSMRVHPNGYKCMSCGAHGSLEKLYSKVSGRIVSKERSYNPAQRIWKSWEEKFGSIQIATKVAHRELASSPGLGNYLKSRKIDENIKPGKLGFLDGYYTFPIRDEWDEVHGIIARASPTIQTKSNRYTASPNCPIKLYAPNWRKVLKDSSLYVCYGTIDSWTLVMAGYAGITGISGQEFNFHHLDRFRKPIYIIPDRGEEKNSLALQCSLGWRGMSLFLEWPDGCKDLNDVHVNYGIDKVIELIEKAKEKYSYE